MSGWPGRRRGESGTHCRPRGSAGLATIDGQDRVGTAAFAVLRALATVDGQDRVGTAE